MIYIHNTIGTDELSKVRGLGRYYKALDSVLKSVRVENGPYSDLLINPFFNILGKPWLGVLSKKGKRVAVIHDVIPLEYPSHYPLGIKGRIWRAINQFLILAYDIFVTDSETSKRMIIQHLNIPENRVHVAYPYSPLEPADRSSDKELPSQIKPYSYVLYVGDVNWHKNIANIARACVHANVKLVCVGKAFMQPITNNPWLNELEEFLRIAAQNPSMIIRLGYVENELLVQLYSYSIVNMLISHTEGFGYSYIEAGMCGTPSILADRPIFHEISGDEGALFVREDSIEDISQAIILLNTNVGKRNKLGVSAKKRSESFNKNSFSSAWQTILA